jgi:hypothetical protein
VWWSIRRQSLLGPDSPYSELSDFWRRLVSSQSLSFRPLSCFTGLHLDYPSGCPPFPAGCPHGPRVGEQIGLLLVGGPDEVDTRRYRNSAIRRS